MWPLNRSARRRPFSALVLGSSALAAALATVLLDNDGRRAAARSAVAEPLVTSYPGPGWRVASPATAITFDGANPTELGDVRVRGSRSGPHPGRLHALRLGPGAVFTPSQPFTPGEVVTVRTSVPVRGASGTVFSFTVARWGGPRVQPLTGAELVARRPGRPSTAGLGACRMRRIRFRTQPSFRPVDLCLHRRPSPATARGRIFVAPRTHAERPGGDPFSVMMLSGTGHLLWYLRRPYIARDLSVQSYAGRPVLAYYQGLPGGADHYALLDQRYRLIKRIRAGNGYTINTHEMQLTPRGTAYVSAYEAVRLAGHRRRIIDFVIQEVDVETGDVLFEWHALDHVPPSASYRFPPRDDSQAWDYFHGNSIDPPPSQTDTLIVSARNTSAVYGIDRATGALRWTLGGKRDSLGFVRRSPRQQFCAQHDARWLPNGDILVFDNGGAALGNSRDCPLHKARVQRFRLDLDARTARVVRTIRSEPSSETGAGYYTWAVGSSRLQPNGNVLVNWGTTGRITEVAPNGRVVFGLRLERYTYRAIRSPWTGTPGGRPRVAARRAGSRAVRLWASWNGATEVARWRPLAGDRASRLRPAGKAFPFRGLETSGRIRTRARYVSVEALDARGAVLGRARAVAPRGG